MKRLLLILVLLVPLAAVPGCQQNGKPADPTVQLTIAEDFYATTENLLADAAKAGLIPDRDKPAIVQARDTARAALQTAQANVARNASQFDAALAQFNAVAPQLVKFRNLYAKKG